MKHKNTYKCTCDSTFQDKRYGKGYRLHNPDKDGGQGMCTVCGKKGVR